MVKVYIAGPLTGGPHAPWTRERRVYNVDVACAFAAELIQRGFLPFVPHLSHYIDRLSLQPIGYESWMEQDFEWLQACDCLYRLPGESPGADREVEFAKQNSIPVFNALSDLEVFRDVKLHGPKLLGNDELAHLWRDQYKARADRIVAGGLPVYDTELALAVMNNDQPAIVDWHRQNDEYEQRRRERVLQQQRDLNKPYRVDHGPDGETTYVLDAEPETEPVPCDSCDCVGECEVAVALDLTERIADLIERFGAMFPLGFTIEVDGDELTMRSL